MAAICFFENWQEYISKIAFGSKISTKSLYLARFKEIEADFGFCIFRNNSKWPPFLGEEIFFENWQEYVFWIPCGLKISTKSLYLTRLRR